MDEKKSKIYIKGELNNTENVKAFLKLIEYTYYDIGNIIDIKDIIDLVKEIKKEDNTDKLTKYATDNILKNYNKRDPSPN